MRNACSITMRSHYFLVGRGLFGSSSDLFCIAQAFYSQPGAFCRTGDSKPAACGLQAMHAEEPTPRKAEPTDGLKSSVKLVTITLHNNSATATSCPDGYKPKPEEIPYPRPNNVFEEALAVTAMFLAFTMGVLLPFILMACIPAVIVYKSKLAAALLVITSVDWFLPAGKVRNSTAPALVSHASNTWD